MKLPNIFRASPVTASPNLSIRTFADVGVILRAGSSGTLSEFDAQLASPDLDGLSDQLLDEGYAISIAESTLIPWDALYDLFDDVAYRTSLPLLRLPELGDIIPKLQSRGGLIDPSFAVTIFGWFDSAKQPVSVDDTRGAVVSISGELKLLPRAVWEVVRSVGEFHRRTNSERTDSNHRHQWGRIRRAALAARADLDDFLLRTVVLAPEKLNFSFRKVAIGDAPVVEIVPDFEGSPQGWLDAFDRAPAVRERYDVPVSGGVVQVLAAPKVQSVLRKIKSLPGRRVAGARAEAFMVNPFAALGEEANDVVDEQQFTTALSEAGLTFERFRPHIVRNDLGYPAVIGITIDDSDGNRETLIFSNDDLAKFIEGLEQRLQRQQQLYGWSGYQFELLGDTSEHLALLKSGLDERRQPPVLITWNRIYDLSSYYERISEIGDDEAFISPYIVKKNEDEGWFPENLFAVVELAASKEEPAETVPLRLDSVEELRSQLEKARGLGAPTVTLPGSTRSIFLEEAENLVAAFEKGLQEPPTERRKIDDRETKKRPSLVIKGNISSLDHHEERPDLKADGLLEAERPTSLKPEIELHPHQVAGIARLQHLFRHSPDQCRGVLLADDMGLGKTIQLLTFMAWVFEKWSDLPPALVVAPVALLDNWREEVARFFKPDSISVLTAYGEELSSLRVSKESIDTDLRNEGLVKFLRPQWRGDAQIVLTTYETLRDLEFSFALETWSIIVCDEAQKIKNPNALVTRAAKKQNVRFRVACTGTPVENSLADLWCLYDFVQPGLLGSLNEFGKVYGRPIEAIEKEAGAKLDELRKKIEPQLIRRTKAEVAKNLPEKIDVEDCKVPLSTEQRGFYVGILELFSRSKTDESADSYIHHLGLLQHLRLICADPRQYGIESFAPEALASYRRKAPKMDWLLRTLGSIKRSEEKALVFAEHRDMQRLLQHYIALEFGCRPEIVNGDTSVSSRSTESRHKKIRDFQEASGFGVIILSPLAVGFGVNIQGANHVIHYLRHWNPAKEDQATGRAYRIGQTRKVYVYCPLSVAADFKTFDVKLDELLQRRRILASDMLHGNGSLSGFDFDLREIAPDHGKALKDELITLDLLERMNARFFEAFIATLWRSQGFDNVELTPQSDDGGIDVVATRGATGALIQCKSSTRQGARLGWDAVKDVVGGTKLYEKRYPGVAFTRVCATNQFFNSTAHGQASANGVEMVEQDAIASLLKQFPITKLDVLRHRSR